MIKSTKLGFTICMLTVQTIAIDEFLKDCGEVFGLWLLETAIDDVGGTLLHGKLVHLSEELRNQLLAYFLIPVLECLLYSIVTVRVLCQLNRVSYQFLHQLLPVFLLKSFRDYDLNNTKPAIVSGKFHELVVYLLKDELTFLLFETFYNILDHVGALDVLIKV